MIHWYDLLAGIAMGNFVGMAIDRYLTERIWKIRAVAIQLGWATIDPQTAAFTWNQPEDGKVSETVELRPCDCGSPASADKRWGAPPWRISCETCSAGTAYFAIEAEAIAAWNRRTIPPAIIAFLCGISGAIADELRIHPDYGSEHFNDVTSNNRRRSWLAALAAAGMTEDEARREGMKS